jgi:hypothetical protein
LQIRDYSPNDASLQKELKSFVKTLLKVESKFVVDYWVKFRKDYNREEYIELVSEIVCKEYKNDLSHHHPYLPFKLHPCFCYYFHDAFTVSDPTLIIDYKNLAIDIRQPPPASYQDPPETTKYLNPFLNYSKRKMIDYQKNLCENILHIRNVYMTPLPTIHEKILIRLKEEPTGDCCNGDADSLCSICLTNKPFIHTKCKHVFCSCILTNALEYNKFACPYCREGLKELDIHDSKGYHTLKSVEKFLPNFVEFA